MDKEVDRIITELRQPRRCRVCGLWFRPERWTALLCSTTCQQRSHRGGDLAYLADNRLDPSIRDFDRRQHEHVAALMNQIREHNHAVLERRSESDAAESIGLVVLKQIRARIQSMPAVTSKTVEAAIDGVMPNCPAELREQIIALVLQRGGT